MNYTEWTAEENCACWEPLPARECWKGWEENLDEVESGFADCYS